MKIHELEQGSPEWHAHRAKFKNASDAPAMLGVSPYKTRNDLLHEVKTGLSKPVDYQTQLRFDEGHRSEALARPLGEEIVGESLYPVTGSEGQYSASFDGLTMAEDIAFEHKSLNADLRACISEQGGNGNDFLPLVYKVQMEQQLMVSGAEKVLFMATSWNGSVLAEQRHCWYVSDAELRQRIIDGWAQFDKDLEAYVPAEVIEKPKADVAIELPALFVHAKGEITTSNMKEYGEALALRLADVRAIKLQDDQDFANAKQAATMFRDQITKLKAAKEAMLSQTVTIGEAARMMDAWSEDLRVTALKLEKDVEREDLVKKTAMINDAKAKIAEHMLPINTEFDPIKVNYTIPDFAGAIKGKRNYASMQGALDDAVAQFKIDTSAIATDLRTKLSWYKDAAKDYTQLFADLQTIIYKPMDDFKLVVDTRIAEAKRLQVEREAKIASDAAAAALLAQQPKPEPVAEVKPEVAATTANDAPKVETKSASILRKAKPSVQELCHVIAKHYMVSDDVALAWLTESDFDAALEAKLAA